VKSDPRLFSRQCSAVTIPTELQLSTYCHDKSQVNNKSATKSVDMQVGDEIYEPLFAVSLLLMFSLHYG
jgi:hypothetical protein